MNTFQPPLHEWKIGEVVLTADGHFGHVIGFSKSVLSTIVVKVADDSGDTANWRVNEDVKLLKYCRVYNGDYCFEYQTGEK